MYFFISWWSLWTCFTMSRISLQMIVSSFELLLANKRYLSSFVRHFMTTSSRASYKPYLDAPKIYFQFLLYNYYIGREVPWAILYWWINQYRLYKYVLILAHASSCMEITPLLRGNFFPLSIRSLANSQDHP